MRRSGQHAADMPACLPGMNSSAPCVPKCNIGVRTEILADPAIECGERVRWRKPVLKQQPHRVALVAEARLHADEDVAEPNAKHEDVAPIALRAPGGGTPTAFDFVEPRRPPHVIVRRLREPLRWPWCRAARDFRL